MEYEKQEHHPVTFEVQFDYAGQRYFARAGVVPGKRIVVSPVQAPFDACSEVRVPAPEVPDSAVLEGIEIMIDNMKKIIERDTVNLHVFQEARDFLKSRL